MIKNDEDYLIRRTYTNYGGSGMKNNEIKKYKLDDVIEVDTGEYVIVGYGDLETRFIDDRNVKDYVEVKEELECYEK